MARGQLGAGGRSGNVNGLPGHHGLNAETLSLKENGSAHLGKHQERESEKRMLENVSK